MPTYTATASSTTDLPADAVVSLVFEPGSSSNETISTFTKDQVLTLNQQLGVDVVALGYVPWTTVEDQDTPDEKTYRKVRDSYGTWVLEPIV